MALRRRYGPAGPPRSQVRSEELQGRQRSDAPPAARFHWERLPLVLFGYAILALWWAAGGKWTIEGMPLLLNEVFNFFHVSIRLAPITWPGWYAWLAWLPLGISFVEHKYSPWHAWGKWSILSLCFVFGVWLVVTGADWGSTWQAITHPAPDDWLIARQVAAIPLAAALWVTLTTFVPEIGFAVLSWWLWEPDPALKKG
jgi:hypothetical protein